MSTAKRYQPQGLLGEQGGVQTFAGRDAMTGLPVRLYSFMGTPTARDGELRSDFVPPILSATSQNGAGEVVTAFSESFKKQKGTVAPAQVAALLRETATALDDAARAGVVHGDLSPERVFYDREAGGRFVLEGYGVPWRVRPSEFSPPERIGGASFSGDVFAWARTVKHLSGPLPGELRDLLDRCLSADPAARPNAREVRAALERYPFPGTLPGARAAQARRDTSAFEGFSDPEAEDDGERDLLGGLTLLPQAEPSAEPSAPAPSNPGHDARPDGPRPGGNLRVVPAGPDAAADGPPPVTPAPNPSPSAPATPATRPVRVSPANPPQETFRRLDATSAYEARLAAYKAKQRGSVPAGGAAESDGPSRAPEVRRTPPRGALPSPAEADLEYSDIDDRAPDPTLYRGGRRVLLLTLLGIALLVLIALQFLNT